MNSHYLKFISIITEIHKDNINIKWATTTENNHIILKPFRRKYYINIIIIQRKKKIIKILQINIIIIIIKLCKALNLRRFIRLESVVRYD